MKDNPSDLAEFAEITRDREISRVLRSLDVELEAIRAKAKPVGIGLPIVMSTAALLGGVVGPEISAAATVLGGLTAAFVLAVTTYATSRGELIKVTRNNPWYYLWTARRP